MPQSPLMRISQLDLAACRLDEPRYVARTAGNSLVVMLGTLTVGMFGIWQIGKRLGVEQRSRSLIAVGTSICGVSAIAAAAPVVEATTADISNAVAVVVIFNIIAVVIFPIVAHVAGFSPHTFGVWAGTAINDTSSVLAAGHAFGSGAATFAAVVKLSRVVMILPVTFAMALVYQRGSETTGQVARRPLTTVRNALPWFVIGFVMLSLGRSLGLWSQKVATDDFGKVAGYGVVLALATIGLSTDLHDVFRTGRRGLLLGGAGWVLLATTSLALQGLVSLL